jgi:hypothetical protein
MGVADLINIVVPDQQARIVDLPCRSEVLAHFLRPLRRFIVAVV